jgi:hypothetical protein
VTTSEGSWGQAAPGHAIKDASRPFATRAGDALLYVLIAAFVSAAWWISQQGLYHPSDEVGYWIGVAGGSMMLLLLTYPLRKRVRVFQRWGKAKWWLWFHMALGIGGPVLILAHCTFRTGSLNAAVALYSMLIVAVSGVIGRFLYLRVNRGLHSEMAALQLLRKRAGLEAGAEHSKLSFAPAVEARLRAFERAHLGAAVTDQAGSRWRRFLSLPYARLRLIRACLRELEEALEHIGIARHWSAAELRRQKRLAGTLVRRHARAVSRVAQFEAYERLFALWHVAHVPFVYLLVASAVVHIVAVHAY